MRTHNCNRLRNRVKPANIDNPNASEVANSAATAAASEDKAARITKRQLGVVLGVLHRAAKGGDATLAVDAADAATLVSACLAAAPSGPKAGRVWFLVRFPSGAEERHLGAAAVAKRIGRSKSHVQNQLSKATEFAEFPCLDANGNPAAITVSRLA